MAKFAFKLQAVLTQRSWVELEKQRLLAAAQLKMASLQTELTAVNDQMNAATDHVRKTQMVGKLDMPMLAAHRRYIATMQRKGMGLVQQIAVAQKQVDEARVALAEAAKQRKVLEKLKERQKERWLAEGNRKQLLELDEIGMQLDYRHRTDAESADADDAVLPRLAVDAT
jgi:flagellar FliJ protein